MSLQSGKSKGLGFDRVLIVATEKHTDFLEGKPNLFSSDKTEKAKNTLYVLLTRARMSGTFISEAKMLRDEIMEWDGK